MALAQKIPSLFFFFYAFCLFLVRLPTDLTVFIFPLSFLSCRCLHYRPGCLVRPDVEDSFIFLLSRDIFISLCTLMRLD